MKTSNKLLLAALLVLLGSLTAFNMGLRAEYARGRYKDPLRNTTALRFQGFTAVDVQGATTLKVKIVAGPYGVRRRDDATDFVKISQQGSRLTIALAFAEELHYLGGEEVVTISCPQLRQLSVSSLYSINGKSLTDRQRGRGGRVRVQGFVADSLTLHQDDATRVELAANQLGYLHADAGPSPGSKSVLRIDKDNRVQAAAMRMQHQSELQLESKIPAPRYQFGDSAKATLTGAALGGLGQ